MAWSKARTASNSSTAAQTRKAVEEADRVLLVVDGRTGLTPPDRHVADVLRRTGKSVLVVVNKTEGLAADTAAADFHALGFGGPVAVSAAHAEGLEALMTQAMAGLEGAADAPVCARPQTRSGSPSLAARTSASRH